MIVYLLTNRVNGKRYVGKTTQSLKRRWSEHVGDSRSRSTTALHRAIEKHTPESFQKEVLSVGLNEKVLSVLEIFWIRELETRTPNGYNLTDGGEGVSGAVRSLETREKLSKIARNRSPELIERMRIGGRGYKHTPEAIEQMSVARTGRKDSPATRQKKSIRMLGNTNTLGHKASPETRAKLSAAALGRKDPLKTRINKSVGAKQGWITRRKNAA
jgi:group I intron endonuclease